MKRRAIMRTTAGVVLILLGLLWTAQGADLVRIEPVLCVADCRPITGGSVGWLAAGVATVVAGLLMAALRRRR